MMRKKQVGTVLLFAFILGAAVLACGNAMAETQELNFGIISTDSTQNLKKGWEPFLADMSKALGMKVNGFFAPDYAGVIEAMRFNKVQIAWFGNKSAMEAVDRAGGEVFAQSVDVEGNPGYWSLLIVHKDSEIKSLDDIIKNPRKYDFGNGDPNSTSGFLVPSYYVFAKNNIDPKTHFKTVRSANHETNFMAVVNKQVDVATNNTEELAQIQKNAPDKAAQIRIIWKSPLIAADPLVWRKDMPDELKQKIKSFILGYGRTGPGAERERKVLAGMVGGWAPFKESSDEQLIPIRQLSLFKDKTKLQADENMDQKEKAQKIADIDAKLAELQKHLVATGQQ
jgi:phosphonate transport system substrate-binding protein